MKNIKKLVSIALSTLLVTAVATGCTPKPAPTAGGEKKVDYPTKPIQLIVPVKAGGDTDYNARVLATFLEKYIGKSVVVTNIDGGATITGSKDVLSSPADGYKVIVNGTDMFVPKMLGTSDISLDSFKTAGISLIDNSTVVAVHKDSGYKDLKDFVEKTKTASKPVEYGMKIGATNQIFGVAMNKDWGAKVKPVDVGNNAAKMVALVGKQTDVININYSVAESYFKTGEFVPLALLGTEKNSTLKNIPLASDFGLKNLDYSKFFWLGMHPDTKDEVVNIFSEALKKACADPEYIKKMEERYLTVRYMAPKDAHDFADKFYKEAMLPYLDAFKAAQ
jgi:tripartite-type tricarboxylate transporter receptor subunit TctC